jgi:hypothetical protein
MKNGKCLALAALALALLAGPAQAQTMLRYKFKDGEKLQYGMNQDMKMTMNVAGMDIEMKLKQSMDMHWDVTKVDDGGNAKVRMKMGRVKMSMEGPTGNIEVDSGAKDAEEPDNPIGKIFSQMVKAIAALEMTFTITPSGKVKDEDISEASLKKLKALPDADKFTGGMFTPDGLKKMVGAGLVFPEGAISKGKTWSEKMSMKTPVGKMAGTMKYTYEGAAEKDGKKVEKIAIKPELKIIPDPDAPVQVKLKNQKDKGFAYFDNQAGRLVEVTNEGTMEMEIEAMGVTIMATTTQTSTMRLKGRGRPGGQK